MKFFVSRQQYWGVEKEDGTVVEIAGGGCDCANPDMLCPRWKSLGEGKEFRDPIEAVEAAIAICQAWRTSGEPNAKIAFGYTGGNTLPFEAQSIKTLREKAQALYDSLPKCEYCNSLLPEERDRIGHDLISRYVFCSTGCAEKDYEIQLAHDVVDQIS